MKLTALAKVTLAIGILTTGTLTTEAHSGHAKQIHKSVNKHDKEALHRYYSGNFKEMKNINALKHGKNNLRFKYRGRLKYYCLEMSTVNINSEDIRA